MIKTRTLTFHFPINNGAFLQAFALQRVLWEHLGVGNEIIDFRSKEQTAAYKLFQPIRGKQSLIRNAFSALHYPKLKRRSNRFSKMQRAFLAQTERVMSTQEALRLAEEADVAIVGSDQVWNIGIGASGPAFFLPGVKTKKITYAASTGSTVNERALVEYREAISDFDALGIREPALAEALDFYKGEKQVVLDPTLLLDKAAYDCLYSNKTKAVFKGEYILLYSMRYSDDYLKTVKRIAEMLSLPVVVPFTTFKTLRCLKYGFKIIYDASPDVFLRLVSDAKLVLTNSFHGTAFSVIFRKNFFHICDGKEGSFVRDDRIDELLEAVGLKRNIGIDTDLEKIRENMSVVYDEAEKTLAAQRLASIEFLRRNIPTMRDRAI